MNTQLNLLYSVYELHKKSKYYLYVILGYGYAVRLSCWAKSLCQLTKLGLQNSFGLVSVSLLFISAAFIIERFYTI